MGRLLISGIAALAAIAGLFGVAASGEAGSVPKLSINVPNAQIKYGKQVTVRGQFDSPTPGGARGVEVEIYENPWPYDDERVIKTVKTDQNGRFSLKVRPKFNTRYRAQLVADPTVTSKYPAIWVSAKRSGADVDFIDERDGLISTRMIFKVHPDLPFKFAGRKLFWYLNDLSANRIVPEATSRTREPRPGVITSKARFEIPTDHAYRFFTPWCFETERRDIGVGKPVDPTCPRGPKPTSEWPRLGGL